jgi:hypothetical protein
MDGPMFLIGLFGFCALLALIGAIADAWDSHERRDARERNHARRQR